MFTGIIEAVAPIRSISQRNDGNARFEIELGAIAAELTLGASIAVSGACLSVAEKLDSICAFDVVPETLRATNLADRRPGDHVNLERCLRVGERFDGHVVQGHVDGCAPVLGNGASGGEWRLRVQTPPHLARYIVHKGSIAIDGVSLTIAGVEQGSFWVALIPATLERTTLGRLRNGQRVNLETDVMARLVVDRVDALLEVVAPAAARRSPLGAVP